MKRLLLVVAAVVIIGTPIYGLTNHSSTPDPANYEDCLELTFQRTDDQLLAGPKCVGVDGDVVRWTDEFTDPEKVRATRQ